MRRAQFEAEKRPGDVSTRERGSERGSWSFKRGLDKICLRVNAANLSMSTEIASGQDFDYTGYDLVMADKLPQPAVLVADMGYAYDKIREDIESRNAMPMIAMRKIRRVRRAVEMTIYSLRG